MVEPWAAGDIGGSPHCGPAAGVVCDLGQPRGPDCGRHQPGIEPGLQRLLRTIQRCLRGRDRELACAACFPAAVELRVSSDDARAMSPTVSQPLVDGIRGNHASVGRGGPLPVSSGLQRLSRGAGEQPGPTLGGAPAGPGRECASALSPMAHTHKTRTGRKTFRRNRRRRPRPTRRTIGASGPHGRASEARSTPTHGCVSVYASPHTWRFWLLLVQGIWLAFSITLVLLAVL